MSKSNYQLIIIVCASVLVLFANLWGYPIYILDEVKNAQCAKEMFLSNEFIVPTFNDILRADKPPLHYYFMMMGYKLFGINPFGARFFSSVFGVLTISLTFIITRKYVNEKASKVAAVVLLSSVGFVFQFHLATPDPYLVFFMSAGLFSFFHFFKSENKLYLYLTYASIGLAALAKGPIGIVLPFLSILFFLLAKKKLKKREIKNLKLIQGFLIILLINLPWYLMVHIETDGQWTKEFFLFHNFGRYTSSEIGHGSAFFLPTLFILAWALPFSSFLIQSLHKPFKYRLNDLAILSLVTFTVTIVFFSLSSNKLIHYVSPALPFVAIMTGNFLFSVDSKNWDSSKMNWSVYFLIAFSLIIPGLFYYLVSNSDQFHDLRDHSFVIFALVPGALLLLYFLLKKSLNGLVITMATTFILVTNLIFYVLLPAAIEKNPVKESKSIVEQANGLATFRYYNNAFVYETDKKIINLWELNEIKLFFEDYPDGIVITRDKYLNEMNLEEKYQVIFRKSDLIDENFTVILKKNTN